MQTHEIQLYGYPLKLKTEHNKEILETFKSEVEEQIKNVQANNSQVPLEKALLLTCLCLAESKYLLKQAFNKSLNDLESQTQDILEDVELSCQGISFKE